MSGVTTTEHSLTVDGRTVQLFVMKPDHMEAHPGVMLFLHGAVWIAGNFENHKRLVCDLVVESGQPAVFLQYTPAPTARYPVQMNQAYAALEWTAEHASEFGADPSRIAVVGNSGRRRHDRGSDLDGQGPERAEDQLLGAVVAGDQCGRRHLFLAPIRQRPFPAGGLHEVWLGYLCAD